MSDLDAIPEPLKVWAKPLLEIFPNLPQLVVEQNATLLGWNDRPQAGES